MKLKIFIFLAVSAVCFSALACSHSDKIKRGNEIVTRIEDFKIKNDKLPTSLSEVGIKETESGPIYYEKKSESRYILWFGKELGESVVYDSDTKQWK